MRAEAASGGPFGSPIGPHGDGPPIGSGGWPYDDEVSRDLAIDLGTANTLVFARVGGSSSTSRR
jgi:hypothetical protein